jgi:exopolyphosphatase/guanosine-5'-triphosphate,3'-diphosphate pyrophosphatase
MTPAQQIVVAHIARYHRGAAPKMKHRGFAQLDRASRERVVKLAALLRFADGMDRGHVAAVGELRVKMTDDAVRVSVAEAAGATSVRLECWGASRKRHLLEEVLGRPIIVVAPDGTELSADDDGDGE